MSGRGRGRPSEGRPVQVRIPEDLLDALDLDAQDRGLSRAAMLRRVLTARYSDWPWAGTVVRSSGITEHTCVHGVGHPDPASADELEDPSVMVHGCDGCCQSPVWVEAVDVWADVS